jgi:hypothetical protein
VSSETINIGFQHRGTSLLGFELKITQDADIYMLVFERGHRRMHISYHQDGRYHYKADTPNAESVIIKSDFPTGKMEPVGGRRPRPVDVVDREKVGLTGWGIADVESANLNQFTPGTKDILIDQPKALSLGFCVNVIGPQASPRARIGSDPILERRYIQAAVNLEIEVFDWLAQ